MSQLTTKFPVWSQLAVNSLCKTYSTDSWEIFMSHIHKTHLSHMKTLCHTFQRVMLHIWMGHVTHSQDSWYTYEKVMSHIQNSHVVDMNESCCSVLQCCHITRIERTRENFSLYTCTRVMLHTRVSHVAVCCSAAKSKSTDSWEFFKTAVEFLKHQ